VGAVLLVLALAGCTSRVGGSPVTSSERPTERPTEGTAPVVLGDLSAIDPCSLTDLKVFDELGTAKFAHPESFDYCTIDMTIGGADIKVYIGEIGKLSQTSDPAAKRVRELDGGMYVNQPAPAGATCTQELVFPDEITIRASAANYRDGSPDLCPTVSAAMDKIIDVVEHGRVGHRHPKDNSLIPLDACGLVPDDTITAQPGFADAYRLPSPAGHHCYWQTPDSTDRYVLMLQFTAGLSPSVITDDGSTTSIAGRETFTNRFPETDDCSVVTGHIIFDEIDEYDLSVEQAEVHAFAPGGRIDNACQAATAVAKQVWPHLPKP
jgi:hypothetical protein